MLLTSSPHNGARPGRRPKVLGSSEGRAGPVRARQSMNRVLTIFLLAALGLPVPAQVFRFSREQMIRHTAGNPFERFPDGRPKVPDSALEALRMISVDTAVDLMRERGYPNQFAGDFQILHPGRKLVGRAVTAQYVPWRPDLAETIEADAKQLGLPSGTNQRVIDLLGRNDVPVVDLMGAAEGRNFGGDNLHAAIYGATGTGAVVDGTIRDLEGIHELPSQVYFRAPHPAAVGGVLILGINIPVKIGPAIVLPGDVVLGDRTGVAFIPPRLVLEAIERAKARGGR